MAYLLSEAYFRFLLPGHVWCRSAFLPLKPVQIGYGAYGNCGRGERVNYNKCQWWPPSPKHISHINMQTNTETFHPTHTYSYSPIFEEITIILSLVWWWYFVIWWKAICEVAILKCTSARQSQFVLRQKYDFCLVMKPFLVWENNFFTSLLKIESNNTFIHSFSKKDQGWEMDWLKWIALSLNWIPSIQIMFQLHNVGGGAVTVRVQHS